MRTPQYNSSPQKSPSDQFRGEILMTLRRHIAHFNTANEPVFTAYPEDSVGTMTTVEGIDENGQPFSQETIELNHHSKNPKY